MDTANSLDADRVVRAPFPTNPEDFDADTRISFDKTADTYILEDEGGEEWEWLATASKWTAVVRKTSRIHPVLSPLRQATLACGWRDTL